jgi:hypothetical protein
MHEEEQKCIHTFSGGGELKGRDILEDISIDRIKMGLKELRGGGLNSSASGV